MADKDFLSQFSSENKKPESFKEEERVKIEKPKKNINPVMIIIPTVLILIISAVLVYAFLFPHIKVENFEGQAQGNATAWMKQNEIESTGIVFKEEYNFDVPKGSIVSQTPNSGKVKKNAKITFVVSKGADPDELIVLPDLKNMAKSEIEQWISDNKLSNTKINTAYSDTVAKDQVIKVELNVDEDKFTRGTSLKINISKGEAPAGVVKVENFKNQTYSSVETWAKNKKITLKKAEAYSDDIAKGLIMSQSIAADKEVKEGETLTVTISLGKGVTVPNFLNMSENDYKTWKENNTGEDAIDVKEKVYYSDSDKYIIKQSVTAGTTIAQSETVNVTINKGDGFYFEEALSALGYSYAAGSTSYDKLDDWSYKTKELGLSVQVHVYTGEYVESELPKGTIIEIAYAKDEDGNKYSMNEKLPLNAKIFCKVSSGNVTAKNPLTINASEAPSLYSKTYDEWKTWCNGKNADIQIKIFESDGTTASTSVDNGATLYLVSIDYEDEYKQIVSVGASTITSITSDFTLKNEKGATIVLKK